MGLLVLVIYNIIPVWEIILHYVYNIVFGTEILGSLHKIPSFHILIKPPNAINNNKRTSKKPNDCKPALPLPQFTKSYL